MWDAWAAGDRKGALAVIPDEVVDDLVVHGSFDECRAHVQRYVDDGVTIPAPMIIPFGVDLRRRRRRPLPGGRLTGTRALRAWHGRHRLPPTSLARLSGAVGPRRPAPGS